MNTERYIFDHTAREFFYTSLKSIHTKYVDKLVMCGVDAIGADIETIKMTRMFNEIGYLKRVMGGMKQVKPGVHILLTDESSNTEAECFITYLDNQDDVKGTYMIQNIHNYPEAGKCLYQFWKFNTNLPDIDINNIYNDTQ